jgi:hypothetical protein
MKIIIIKTQKEIIIILIILIIKVALSKINNKGK